MSHWSSETCLLSLRNIGKVNPTLDGSDSVDLGLYCANYSHSCASSTEFNWTAGGSDVAPRWLCFDSNVLVWKLCHSARRRRQVRRLPCVGEVCIALKASRPSVLFWTKQLFCEVVWETKGAKTVFVFAWSSPRRFIWKKKRLQSIFKRPVCLFFCSAKARQRPNNFPTFFNRWLWTRTGEHLEIVRR